MKKTKSPTTDDRRPTTSPISPALFSSTKMDWETPRDLFKKLDDEFHFTLDVCASVENAKCRRFFSESENGLTKSWKKDVCWMNPPYGWEISLWMAKAYQESLEGATVVCLVPSRTDTVWWHDYAMKGTVRFIKGRLKFGDGKGSAPFPSAIVVFFPPRIVRSKQKEITRVQSWTHQMIHFSDGSQSYRRVNKGFNVNEMLGMASMSQLELSMVGCENVRKQFGVNIERIFLTEKKAGVP